MKKLILGCSILIGCISFAQNNNTFPNTGNVGINTNGSPTEKLEINGNVKIDSCLIVRDSAIVEKDLRTKGRFTVEDKAYFLEKVTMYDKLNVTGNINGDNNVNAANNLNADNNLNIGNNANIDNKLKVSGNTTLENELKLTGIDDIPNINNPNIEFLAKMPNGQVYKVNIGSLITLMYSKDCNGVVQDIPSPAWNNGLNKIFVNYACADVKVGIRTSDPQYFLDVRETTFLKDLKVGEINAVETALINAFEYTNSRDLIQLGVHNASTGNQSDLRFKVGHDGQIYSKNVGASSSFELHNGTGNAVVIYANNGSKIFQLEDGGMMRAREIKVDLDAWPDYVFDEGYKLMTLEELAIYIEKNHHLPGLPLAKDIEEGGLNLGDIVKMQMEKIEEQSLYTIQLNEEVKNLKSENEELKAELNELKSDMEEIKQMLNK